MVISKITSGLGNQMFQYAIGKSISIKNNSIYTLDISAYLKSNHHNGYRLDEYNINEPIISQYKIKYFKLLSILKFNNFIFYKEKQRTLYDKNVFTHPNIYLNGYWQNEKYFLDIKHVLQKTFTPKHDISSTAKEYLNIMQSTNSVCIHIRRGDYLQHPEIGVLPLCYYKEATDYMFKRLDNLTFFIFSDDIQWCMENFTFLNNKIYVRDTTDIDDIFLMQNCKHNIIANSSFSWWGAWLNTNDNKIIISPKTWMSNNQNNYQWVPNTWIQL